MASKTDKILLLLSLNWKREQYRAQIRKNRAVIARIQHMRRKRRACFLFFCESDRLSTTVAGQRNLGQTEGKFSLVYGWRPMDRQRLDGKLTNVRGNLPKTLRRTGSFYWETRYELSQGDIIARASCDNIVQACRHRASYSTVSNLFGVGKGTVCQIVLEVCTCIVEVLFKRLVHLPVTRQDMKRKLRLSSCVRAFPRLSGCNWWMSRRNFGTKWKSWRLCKKKRILFNNPPGFGGQ